MNLCGQTEILDIEPPSESARFIVANETATAHVTLISATPMWVICGPTDPRRIKPIGSNVVALQVEIADMPCLNCYCKHPCEHHSCMKAITPEREFEEITARPQPPALFFNAGGCGASFGNKVLP